MEFKICSILTFAISWFYTVVTFPTTENNSTVMPNNDNLSLLNDLKITLMDVESLRSGVITNKTNIRVKKQSSGGAGKYAEASKMPQIKLLRIYLQLFRNFWDRSYVGGAHPFHPSVPKAIVDLYKTKIVQFFFPDIGDDKKSAGAV